MACISYQPSDVNYRQGQFTREKLMNMRRALVDKCQYIINNQSLPHVELNLQTDKIFKDLMQYYNNMEKSVFSSNSGKNDFGMNPNTHNTSFMPAISQRTFQEPSQDESQK